MSQALPYSLEQLRDAFGYVESTNNYGELGPITESGNRAYGRYQVMDFNIPSWTERHLGQRLTPEQYLASPEAQDAVFMGQMGDYYARSTGSPAERVRNAGSLWFTGRPFSAETAGFTDRITGPNGEILYQGISNQEYGDRILRALGSAPQGASEMTMDPNPPQQPRGFLGGIFGGQQRQPDPNAGSPTDPFANLSRAQRTMLGFAALRDAAASLEGRDSNYFNSALGGFEAARERERLRAQGEAANRNDAIFRIFQLQYLAGQPGYESLQPIIDAELQRLMGDMPLGGAGVAPRVTTGATPRVTPAGGAPGAGVVQNAEDYQTQRAEVMGQGGPGVNADGTVFETPPPVVTPSESPTEAAPTPVSEPDVAAPTQTPAPQSTILDDLQQEIDQNNALIAQRREELEAAIDQYGRAETGAGMGLPTSPGGAELIVEQIQSDINYLTERNETLEQRIFEQRQADLDAQPVREAARLESEDAARQAAYNRSIIERILEDENLSGVVGRVAGQTEPGTARGMVLFDEGELNVLSQIDQLRGQVFLEARDQLRGGGQITDFEGLRGERALARLDQRGVGLEGYRQALIELDQIFANAEARARGQDVPFPEIDTDPDAGDGAGDGLSEEDQALIDRYTQ